MKQCVLQSQLEELSEESLEKLKDWGERARGNGYLSVDAVLVKGIFVPNLSIGIMIEFLESRGELGQIFHLLGWTGQYCYWRVTDKNGIPTPETSLNMDIDFRELCDALWAAVRKVLNEKKH